MPVAAVLASLVLPGAASEGQKPAPEPRSIQQIAENAKPSIVTVTHSGRGGREQGLGAGFVVSEDGLIATNLHVIGEARPIEVELADGTVHPVTEIHAWDRRIDIAIIRIETGGLPPLALGDSDSLSQGQEVVAFGNPQGLKYSVVGGIVSALRKSEDQSTALIQLAIPVEPGNSGGPLLDRQGQVQGIVTFKSAVTDNLGFAMPVNAIKPLLEKPNPVPMDRWLTIGALDPDRWKPAMGARWSQSAGIIRAKDFGTGFGGRALCVYQKEPPDLPYEIEVNVRLDDESGAAGLIFAADGGDVHYGFYPSSGDLRLTRFEGPDVFSWRILKQAGSASYVPGEWNHLRVRLEENRISCYVNGDKVIESEDATLRGGKAGLCKFRATEPQFRDFRVGKDLSQPDVSEVLLRELADGIETYSEDGDRSDALVQTLIQDPASSQSLLEERARHLETMAGNLRSLAAEVHRIDVTSRLLELLNRPEGDIDLFHAGLVIAQLDNPEMDINAYRDELETMARELAAALPEGAGDREKLAALNEYLFEQNGFHGSRTDYSSRSNSYLNEVLDDREGLPITLSILYIEMAKRIGIESVVGIPLPGHFVVQFRPQKGKRRFIDVFDGGRILTRNDIEEIVLNFTGAEVQTEHLQPTGKKDIILRMLRNLIGIQLDTGQPGKALPYLEVFLALEPESPAERLNRALLRFQNADPEGAREDLGWLLDREPQGMNLSNIRQLYERLEKTSK